MIEKWLKKFANGEITIYQLWDKINELMACHKLLSEADEKVECCGAFSSCPLSFINQMPFDKVSSGI